MACFFFGKLAQHFSTSSGSADDASLRMAVVGPAKDIYLEKFGLNATIFSMLESASVACLCVSPRLSS